MRHGWSCARRDFLIIWTGKNLNNKKTEVRTKKTSKELVPGILDSEDYLPSEDNLVPYFVKLTFRRLVPVEIASILWNPIHKSVFWHVQRNSIVNQKGARRKNP